MPASPAATFRAMAYNNSWANHRLLDTCKGLSQVEFEGPQTGFFGSIQATLNHILIVDWFYVDALEGGDLGPRAWANKVPCPTVAALFVAQSAVDRRLVAWCDALADAGLDGVVSVHRQNSIQRERADRLLLHLFEHQIHHRGQAHAMLSGTSVKPPQLDEFFCEGESDLRAAEFAALGFTEGAIWTE